VHSGNTDAADSGSSATGTNATGADATGPDTTEPDGDPPGHPGLGRTILIAVGASVVALSGIVGWIVGSNGASTVPETTIVGTGLSVSTTPWTLALYGVAVSVLVLGTLFGLVELASRAERRT
jgi:hypothetical protein